MLLAARRGCWRAVGWQHPLTPTSQRGVPVHAVAQLIICQKVGRFLHKGERAEAGHISDIGL